MTFIFLRETFFSHSINMNYLRKIIVCKKKKKNGDLDLMVGFSYILDFPRHHQFQNLYPSVQKRLFGTHR